MVISDAPAATGGSVRARGGEQQQRRGVAAARGQAGGRAGGRGQRDVRAKGGGGGCRAPDGSPPRRGPPARRVLPRMPLPLGGQVADQLGEGLVGQGEG